MFRPKHAAPPKSGRAVTPSAFRTAACGRKPAKVIKTGFAQGQRPQGLIHRGPRHKVIEFFIGYRHRGWSLALGSYARDVVHPAPAAERRRAVTPPAPPDPRIALPVVALLVAAIAGPAALARQTVGVNLASRYPATLDASEPPIGRPWTCDADDVWSLGSFTLKVAASFAVELGPSQVAFGVHRGNVVWAHIQPDTPGRLVQAPAGAGEEVRAIFLRFNPAVLAELFPAETVRGAGNPELLTWARRAAAWKINAAWQSGNLPVIPWRKSIVVDFETSVARRLFMTDTQAGTVKYEPFFERRPLPPLTPVTETEALRAFDGVWEAFDREYAMFGIRSGVDWAKLRATFRPRAAAARTTYETAAGIADLLRPLEDLHVWVSCGDEGVPVYSRSRPLNANRQAAEALVGPLRDSRRGAAWARTEDGIAYLNVYALSDAEMPGLVDNMLETLGDSWGLVLDLRYNGGGDERLARAIAGRFVDQPRVYSRNQYRSGPKHDDLGPMLDRVVEPRGPWRFEAPVVVLIGQGTMSSAESFALMLAQAPQAMTLGDRTAGSSANPRRVDPGLGITVNLPRWIDRLPDGRPLEPEGIKPQVRVEAAPEAFTPQSDPVLRCALEKLREAPAESRRPGRRP
ncbi:MAG: hypothetical protein FLDDKLPJ_02550 [Phycisphaerae bacterium]|nr:hypothetical protein [Phycisphaerae bacterium]